MLLAVFFTSCDRRERLYLFNWAYYTPASVIQLFEQEFNVRVIVDEFSNNEELYAKLRAGGGRYDIVFPSEDYTDIMIQQGMLLRLNHELLPNLRYLYPRILEKSPDPQMLYSVPYFFGAAGIIVNTERVPDFEESWMIFAREDLAGKMMMLDDMREVMGAALHVLGYSANSICEIEVRAAADLIAQQWRPNLIKFEAEAFGKAFANGDAWVVHGYPETVWEEIEGNPRMVENFHFFFPREGGTAYLDSMVILANARNPRLAHEFINFIHRPEIYAMFCDEFRFPTTLNMNAYRYSTVEPLYEITDYMLENFENKYELGDNLIFWTNLWFDFIKIGR